MKTSWEYNGELVYSIPEGAEGFVYLITFKNGDKYIGKKNFFSTRRVKVKGRKNRKVITKESNWKTYNSSSEVVKKRIDNGEPHSREIIHFGASKGSIMYLEIKEMVERNVLCDEKYLNGNILMKIFKCFEPFKIKDNKS
jgi:hypothetical protein